MNPMFLLTAADAFMRAVLVLFSWGFVVRLAGTFLHG
jgi:hypothetical protein